MELWHHHAAVRGELIRGEALKYITRKVKETWGGGDEELQKQGRLPSTGEAKPPTHLEELVVEDLIQGQSVAGVFLQDARDEFLRRVGDGGRQVVLDFLYALVRLLQVEGLKRRVAAHQRVPEKP